MSSSMIVGSSADDEGDDTQLDQAFRSLQQEHKLLQEEKALLRQDHISLTQGYIALELEHRELRRNANKLWHENGLARQAVEKLEQENAKIRQRSNYSVEYTEDLQRRVIKLEEEKDEKDELLRRKAKDLHDRSMSRAEYESLAKEREEMSQMLEAKTKLANDNATYAKVCVSQREVFKGINRDLQSDLRASKEKNVKQEDKVGKLKSHNVVLRGDLDKVQHRLKLRDEEVKTLSEGRDWTETRLDEMKKRVKAREEEEFHHSRKNSLWDDDNEVTLTVQGPGFETLEDQLAGLDETDMDLEDIMGFETALDGCIADELAPDEDSTGGPTSGSSFDQKTAFFSEAEPINHPEIRSSSNSPGTKMVRSSSVFGVGSPPPSPLTSSALKTIDRASGSTTKNARGKSSSSSSSPPARRGNSGDNFSIYSQPEETTPKPSLKNRSPGSELAPVPEDEEDGVQTALRVQPSGGKPHTRFIDPETRLALYKPHRSTSSSSSPASSLASRKTSSSKPSVRTPPSSPAPCSNSFHHLVPYIPLIHMLLCSLFLTYSALALKRERKMWEEANTVVLDWVHEAGWTGLGGWTMPWLEKLRFDLLVWSGAFGENGLGI